MKRKVKYFIIPIDSLIILLFTFYIFLFFLESKIKDKVINTVYDKTEAEISFSDFELNMFSNFPNITLTLKDVLLSNISCPEEDILIKAKSVELIFSINRFFKGEYEITGTKLHNAKFYPRQYSDGRTNWNILKKEKENETEMQNIGISYVEKEENSSVKFKFNKILLEDCLLVYRNDKADIVVKLDNWNSLLSESYSNNNTLFKLKSSVRELTLSIKGIPCLSKIKGSADAIIKSNPERSRFSIEDNNILLNDLKATLKGFLNIENKDNIDYSLNIETPEDTNFKDILSLLPFFYTREFENLKTTGTVSAGGFMNGTLGEKQYSAFNYNLKIDNASLHYLTLPQAISDIDICMDISRAGGTYNNIKVVIDKFNVKSGENSLSARINTVIPENNPYIEALFKGDIDLSSIKHVYPLDKDTELTGKLKANLNIVSYLSGFEKEQTKKIYNGFVSAEDIIYKSTNTPGIIITDMGLTVGPEYTVNSSGNIVIGNNRLSVTGHFDNITPYLLSNKPLNGHINIKSDYINFGEFSGKSKQSFNNNTVNNTSLSLNHKSFRIPAGINILVDADINRALIGNLDFFDIKAEMSSDSRSLNINRATAGVLDGIIKISGQYMPSPVSPDFIKLNLNLEKASISKTIEAMNKHQEMSSLSSNISGEYSIDMNINTKSKKNGIALLPDKVISGICKIYDLTINDADNLTRLLSIPKYNTHDPFVVNNITIPFKINKERLETELFLISAENYGSMSLEGSIGLDKTINCKGNLSLPYLFVKNIPFSIDGSLPKPDITFGVKNF